MKPHSQPVASHHNGVFSDLVINCQYLTVGGKEARQDHMCQELERIVSFLKKIPNHSLHAVSFRLLGSPPAGCGETLRLTLRLSLPLALSHFFIPNSSSRSRSLLGSFLCIKLQNPPRTQPSPLFSLQQASLKSVTGDSSQYIGRAAYHLAFRASQAV